MTDGDPPRELADLVIRQTLPHPVHLRAFLRQAVPELAEGFDCERVRELGRDFALAGWRQREADLPLEIPYRLGAEEVWALVCVFIEHQSDADPLMPLRMLIFMAAYWGRQRDEWEKLPRPRPPLRLRPVLPIVLHTGTAPWGEQSNHRRPAGRTEGDSRFRAGVGTAILEPGGPHAASVAGHKRGLAAIAGRVPGEDNDAERLSRGPGGGDAAAAADFRYGPGSLGAVDAGDPGLGPAAAAVRGSRFPAGGGHRQPN